MQMENVRKIAKDHGIKPGKLSKGDLIRAIQKSEANFDCFGSAANNYCDQSGCLWREDCLGKQKVPH